MNQIFKSILDGFQEMSKSIGRVAESDPIRIDCDHTDCDNYTCLDCGKEMTEEWSARAFDRYKDSMKDGE
jgi:hypothetical protein